ncbi:WcbI family polysaccharide biosynthesis putative acetyltransferase [Microbulbifer harenosus]|uniref:Polysaccharide biosynthesis enzyme WcbI domain-containing protein n=1 Tax=Microbulbifer harenosus TaxID=2576840 RepID=A0ABY2UPX9_9GAMM|nr:WcbI family polysaccharide biosynthesis putative acetyltransferase [Microbulbifer harenosus]TLM80006.1 hypothetical protein FDY93_01125 [Microbulbifer harenosus]
MKIVLVGNCQARPLAKILQSLNEEVQITDVAIVHLLKSEQFSEFESAFDSADIIISQLVFDNYPCDFVRTSFLKNRFDEKVITTLNLYFTGYTPDWFYIRIPGVGPLKGPMGDYQNRTIFESWKRGLSPELAVEHLESKGHNLQFFQSVTSSLEELRSRERIVDVKIAKHIEDTYLDERLFFTFNHPSTSLLVEYARRLMAVAGVPAVKSSMDHLPEMLNQFSPRVNPSLRANFLSSDAHFGVEYSCEESGMIKLGRRKKYEPTEMVHGFYEIYDRFSENFKLANYSGDIQISGI